MKRAVPLFAVMCLTTLMAFAQPMSGNYTVGGTAPDFETLQDCAVALKQRGVSGPVFFNIRPGIYMRNGGNNSVLRLDTVVTGLSSTNRITFQPDAALGGNVDNVRLRFNRINSTVGDRDLIIIRVDYVTLHSLTIEDIDSSHTANNSLIRLEALPGNLNPTVDGFVLEGCKLIGTPFIQSGSSFLGTDHGITSTQNVGDMIIRGNTFTRFLRAVSIVNGSAVAQGTGIVEDNIILEGYRSISGTGNFLGAGIETCFSNSIVRRNVIHFNNTINGGMTGINVISPFTALVEKNLIKGFSAFGMRIFQSAAFPPDSILITNNMITGSVFQAHPSVQAYGIQCEARNTWVVFNTIIVPSVPVSSTAIRVAGPNCRVFNNIIETYGRLGFTILYDQGSSQVSAGLLSDHNILYKDPQAGNGPFVLRNGVQYPNLLAYQTATGLDTNSVSKAIEVVNVFSDLHLTDCQAQDPDLRGIPMSGIGDDFDGDVRSLTAPMRGADEVGSRAVPLWGDVFKIAMPGTPFSVAAGNIDGQPGEDLVIPDYDNREVRIYRNNGAGRSFTHLGNIPTGFRPVVVRLTDFDGDGHLDLVVSADDTNAVSIFWGNGAGGFPTGLTRGTFGQVRSIIPEPFRINPAFRTIILTESIGGLAPQSSLLGFVVNYGQRDPLQIEQLVLARQEPGFPADTLPSVLYDLQAIDLNGAGGYEVAAVGLMGTSGIFGLFDSLRAVPTGFPVPFAHRFHARYTSHTFNTNSYVGHAANLGIGDFDGDSDLDLIATGSSETRCVLIRNQGTLSFVAETVSVNNARALAVLDYNNDGRLDFVSVNRLLNDNGLTLYLNDGVGGFRPEFNCYPAFASGMPFGVAASDFDMDGRTDLAVASASDSVFVLYNFGGGISNVRDTRAQIPTGFQLEQNYPNPFNPTTTITFSLRGWGGDESMTTLKIYDVLGREVATIVNEVLPPGEYVRQWDAQGFASGVYFYRLTAGDFSQTRKLMIIK